MINNIPADYTDCIDLIYSQPLTYTDKGTSENYIDKSV